MPGCEWPNTVCVAAVPVKGVMSVAPEVWAKAQGTLKPSATAAAKGNCPTRTTLRRKLRLVFKRGVKS
jgi:hypothetical protein